jgi:hypothetical protein
MVQRVYIFDCHGDAVNVACTTRQRYQSWTWQPKQISEWRLGQPSHLILMQVFVNDDCRTHPV